MKEFTISSFASIITKWAAMDLDSRFAADGAKKEANNLGGLMTDGSYRVPTLLQFQEAIEEIRKG